VRRSFVLFSLASVVATAASCGIYSSTHDQEIDCSTHGGDWNADTHSCVQPVYSNRPSADASDGAAADADADADLDAAIDGSDANDADP
jgi:hypothetical protein